MVDIEIKVIDSVHLKITCEKSISKELSQYFTFKVPNYKYHPAYRNKMWDGQIRLYNLHKRTLYVGLIDYLLEFAMDRNYTVKSEYNIKEKLTKEIKINNINIEDKSFLHKKHKNFSKEKFHIKLIIESSELKKISSIEANRKIHGILRDEIGRSIHSLQIIII